MATIKWLDFVGSCRHIWNIRCKTTSSVMCLVSCRSLFSHLRHQIQSHFLKLIFYIFPVLLWNFIPNLAWNWLFYHGLYINPLINLDRLRKRLRRWWRQPLYQWQCLVQRLRMCACIQFGRERKHTNKCLIFCIYFTSCVFTEWILLTYVSYKPPSVSQLKQSAYFSWALQLLLKFWIDHKLQSWLIINLLSWHCEQNYLSCFICCTKMEVYFENEKITKMNDETSKSYYYIFL